MSSSMLKLNPEKTEFIGFGSHTQLKKLDSRLPVRMFGNLLHPSAVVQNLGVWFDVTFSFADHVRNFDILHLNALFETGQAVPDG